MTVTGAFEHYQYFNFETSLMRTQTPFKKYRFLETSSKIENATFLCKTTLSEANDETNRTGSTKWTYHKEQRFASNYFLFF